VFLLLAIAAGIGATVWLITPERPQKARAGLSITELLGTENEEFTGAQKPWRITFPNDHGVHPDTQMESWYFTGNVATKQGRWFGFQLTFFRFALEPPHDGPARASAWAAREVYRGHFALTDVAYERFHAYERFSRAALDLSGANTSPVRIWLEDWSVEVAQHDEEDPIFRLRAAADDVHIVLNLRSEKAVILPGDGEASRNSTSAAGSFHSYMLTRMRAQGSVRVKGRTFDVQGLAWLDRAWGQVPLPEGQVVWDRFLLQLDDGREIVGLRLRRRDGSGALIDTGVLVERNGVVHRLGRGELAIEVLDDWESPKDATRYPARWRFRIPSQALELDITPHVADQEMDFSLRYWGGTVRITGRADGGAVRGNGYVELTGYASGSGRH
jgi:Predicted secreted hydrolase